VCRPDQGEYTHRSVPAARRDVLLDLDDGLGESGLGACGKGCGGLGRVARVGHWWRVHRVMVAPGVGTLWRCGTFDSMGRPVLLATHRHRDNEVLLP